MGDRLNRRTLIKSAGVISISTVLGSAERLFSAAIAFTGTPSQQEVILNFRGLWAFIVRKDRITAVTARVGEHSYHADQRHLDEGAYRLVGVKAGRAPELARELVLCNVNNEDLAACYLQMDLPFPKRLQGSKCMVAARFSGNASCNRPPLFPLAHRFHYDIDSAAKLRLEPLQDWPGPDNNPKIELQVKAEPTGPVNNPNHPYDAFTKLIALFPKVDLKLDEHSLKLTNCSGPDNVSNPENCIQVWTQPG
jgi:hypothetical protein